MSPLSLDRLGRSERQLRLVQRMRTALVFATVAAVLLRKPSELALAWLVCETAFAAAWEFLSAREASQGRPGWQTLRVLDVAGNIASAVFAALLVPATADAVLPSLSFVLFVILFPVGCRLLLGVALIDALNVLCATAAAVSVAGGPSAVAPDLREAGALLIPVLMLVAFGWEIRSQVSADTSERRALAWRATHDELTELPNRRALFETMSRFEAEAEPGVRFAVIYVDLDGFKEVNDRHGHAVGDRLLAIAGKRMQAALRAGDMLARIGGDEFAVVLPAGGAADAAQVARRLGASLQAPFRVEVGHAGATVRVSASFGVAAGQTGVAAFPDVLASADAALRRAKRSGKDRFELA